MGETQFQENATYLMEYYKSLIDHVGKQFFEIKKIRFIEWPNLENKPKWQVFLIRFCFPYFFFSDIKNHVSLIQYLIFDIWLIYFAFSLSIAVNFLKCLPVISTTICSTTSQAVSSTNSYQSIIATILLISIFLLTFITYGQVFWFLLKRQIIWQSKLIWVAGFIISMAIIFFYLYSQAYNPKIISILQNTYWLFTIAFIFVFLILPALLVLYSFLILMIFRGGVLVLSALNAFFRFSRPIAFDILERIISKPIKMNQTYWQFSELNLQEIRFMRQWAEQNLEINEKKNIPLAIMLTVIGLFVGTTQVQQFSSELLQNIFKATIQFLIPSTPFSAIDYFVNAPIILTILTVILFLFLIWVTHIQNFTIQGAVVQLCIIAEYAKEKEETQAQKMLQKNSIIYSFINWLSKLI